MTEVEPRRRARTSWAESLALVLAVWNLANWALNRFLPPVDETKALAYMALSVAWVAVLVAARRGP